MSESMVLMTYEESTKIVNFITHRATPGFCCILLNAWKLHYKLECAWRKSLGNICVFITCLLRNNLHKQIFWYINLVLLIHCIRHILILVCCAKLINKLHRFAFVKICICIKNASRHSEFENEISLAQFEV